MDFEAVIGLEVHVQLNTNTKIFCGCSTKFGSGQNSQTCPVCLGLPGVLPVLNQEVVNKSILAGLALNCKIANHSKFDRKNYFYPDLPKAYQISQLDKPICEHGFIEVKTDDGVKKIGITRAHMEEDAGKSIHSDDPTKKVSYVDFNRTGVPLLEVVSDPEISNADEAHQYLTKLKQLMRYVGVSDCNMEEGSLRCDVNLSIRPVGETKLGSKVEVKNLNSFKAVKMAIDHEFERQVDLVEDGEKIVQETRLWNADKLVTMSMRSKEEANDYRYFPDPDLAPIILDDEYIDKMKEVLPELPEVKKARFISEYKLPELDSEVLTTTREVSEFYEETVKTGCNPKKVSNWIMSELLAHLEDQEKIYEMAVTPESLGKLLKLIDDNTISGKIAKTVFTHMMESGKDPEVIVEEKGLKQVTDTGEIEKMVDEVLAENPQSVEDFKNGKQKAMGFLVGQIMKASRGKANPQMVNEILKKKLS